MIGVDYLGAFLGTMVFAFYFYPQLGIFATSFVTGLMNAVVGAGLFYFRKLLQKDEIGRFDLLLVSQCCVVVVLLVLLFNTQAMELIGMDMYLQNP